MNKDEPLSKNQIFGCCKAIYNYEKFLENYVKDKEYQGYLIDKTTFDKVKTKLDYERLKPSIDKNEPFTEFKKKINKKEKVKYIVPKKFNNSNELINELLNDKKFYIVNIELLNIISKEDKYKGKAIKFMMNKEKIKLILNDNDILCFNNNKNGIIEKSSLIQEDSLKNSISPKMNDEPQQKISYDKIIFKIDLEILIRIFYFNKYLREKENNNFMELKKEENSERAYLINDTWMEEYKAYFDYKILENYLINNKEYTDLIIKDQDYLTRNTIKKLLENLPSEYINKINKKAKFDKSKVFNYEKKEINDKNKISYLYNNHIINSKTYDLLTNENYTLNDNLQKIDLYFIGKQKILLLFLNKTNFNKVYDEIGFINDKGKFIPEYILESVTDIPMNLLNIFFKNEYSKFLEEKNMDKCEIKDKSERNYIGFCYKLDIIREKDNETYNEKANLESSNIPHENKYNKNDNENYKNFLNKDQTIIQIIEIMINIYLSQEEIKNKVKQNLTLANDEECYIIRKKWMDKFKYYFDYNKFLNYIYIGNQIDTIKKNKTKKNLTELSSEIMKIFPDDYLKDIKKTFNDKEKIKKLFKKDHYNAELKEKNKIWYYYDEIEIINSDIARIMLKLFEVEYSDKRNFLFGDDKIIMDLNTMPQSSIIIGNYNFNYFEADILLYFKYKKYISYYYEKFKTEGYLNAAKNFDFGRKIEIDLKKDSHIIGKAFKISELEKCSIDSIENENKDINGSTNYTNSITNTDDNNKNNYN